MSTPYGSPAPQVRFDVINQAFALFQQQMGQWVLITLTYLVVVFVAALILAFVPIIGQMVSGIPAMIMLGGIYRTALKHFRGQQVAVADLFDIGDIMGPLIVAGILANIAIGVGSLLCILPGIVVAGLLMFAVPMIADRGVDGVEALRASWNALKSQWLMAGLFQIVMGLITLAGALVCGVGVLFALPVVILSITILYRDFFPEGTPSEEPATPPTF